MNWIQSDKSSECPLEKSWSLCLRWSVRRKGSKQVIQISEMLEKLSREDLKNTQESEAIYRNSFCSSLAPVHISFPKLLHPMEVILYSCLFIFFSLWHGSCQRHKTVLVVSTSLEFWDHLSSKRMCVKFPIFSIALTELVVDAYQKHFSTLYQICAHLRAALELSAQRAGLRLWKCIWSP